MRVVVFKTHKGRERTVATMMKPAIRLCAACVAAVCTWPGFGCDGVLGKGVLGGDGRTPGRIVGGAETGWKSWQGVVAVVSDATMCTGTLIDPEVVITAGHCVLYPSQGVDLEAGDLEILGGADVVAAPVHVADVAAIALHPTWSGTLTEGQVDLALLRLTASASQETYPVRGDPAPQPGNAAVIVGYGRGEGDDPMSSGIHRAGETTVLGATPDLLETGGQAGSCSGDSGGPVFTRQGGGWTLSGVDSFRIKDDCTPGGGSYSTNLIGQRSWIDERVEHWTGHGLGAAPGADAGTGCEPAEVLADGGFEAGSPSAAWAEASLNFGTPLTDHQSASNAAHSGSWYAWFGGIKGKLEEASLTQSVTIPVGDATLSFYLAIATNTPSAEDAFEATLDGQRVFRVTSVSHASYYGYTRVEVDVSAFADGASHELVFSGTTPGSQADALTNILLDDVSLKVCERQVPPGEDSGPVGDEDASEAGSDGGIPDAAQGQEQEDSGDCGCSTPGARSSGHGAILFAAWETALRITRWW